MEVFVFVYAKDAKIIAFGIDDSRQQHNQLISDGWVHTQTLDACRFIEYLHNHCDVADLTYEMVSLRTKITS